MTLRDEPEVDLLEKIRRELLEHDRLTMQATLYMNKQAPVFPQDRKMKT